MNETPQPALDFENASPARKAALTLRFLLELALLAGAGILGWHVASGGWKVVAAVAAVLVIAVIWGLMLSPKARIDLGGGGRLAAELMLFAGVGGGLFVVGFGGAAIVGVIVWAFDRLALRLLP